MNGAIASAKHDGCPNCKGRENALGYHIVAAGGFDIGPGWKKLSRADRQNVSVTLNDPSFPPAIYARLVAGEYRAQNLIWSRGRGD